MITRLGDEGHLRHRACKGEAQAPLAQLYAAAPESSQSRVRWSEGSVAFYQRAESAYLPVTVGKVDGDNCELRKNHEFVSLDRVAAPLSLMDAAARVVGVNVLVKREDGQFDDGFSIHEAHDDDSFDVVSDKLIENAPLAQLAVPASYS